MEQNGTEWNGMEQNKKKRKEKKRKEKERRITLVYSMLKVTHPPDQSLVEYASAVQLCYSPIAFDERVSFWLQRVRSLPCACAYVVLYACDSIAHAYKQQTHTHKAMIRRIEAKRLLSRQRQLDSSKTVCWLGSACGDISTFGYICFCIFSVLQVTSSQIVAGVVTMARILESGITLVHPYFTNKSNREDCLFTILVCSLLISWEIIMK